jgi:hypothetical protein
MIFNDKPNCQVSRILMNPRPILSDSSENDPIPILMLEVFFFQKTKISMEEREERELDHKQYELERFGLLISISDN